MMAETARGRLLLLRPAERAALIDYLLAGAEHKRSRWGGIPL
jgi:hypothetical protein